LGYSSVYRNIFSKPLPIKTLSKSICADVYIVVSVPRSVTYAQVMHTHAQFCYCSLFPTLFNELCQHRKRK